MLAAIRGALKSTGRLVIVEPSSVQPDMLIRWVLTCSDW
jgi:hypothetical protein